MEFGLVKLIANLIGAPEPAIRLLISLLLAYPVGFAHRKYFYRKPPYQQHLFFIICGMSICYFNYGSDLIHSFASIFITYLILKIFGGNAFSLTVVFSYNMMHLLVGYWTTATSTYDIKWTMPHCVLTLRLIAVAFNLYDGQQPWETLSEENQKVALVRMPSMLEVFAHSFFPGTFMVGPQVPMKRYQDFITHKLQEGKNPNELPKSVGPGLRRFALGITYLLIHQIGMIYVYDDYFMSEEYKEVVLWKKLLLLGLWSRITLYKYISCWLITEGSCIITGLTYNGVDARNRPKWDGCSNVRVVIFENATRMNNYIESFNINTNQWVAQYIYKRMKFLNNKMLSHMAALFFLAIWHGFHSGYYATFLFEFIVITAEKDVIEMLEPHVRLTAFFNKIYPLTYVFLRLYTFVVMGYAMIPFILLKYDKYLPVAKQFYFFFHIVCVCIIALKPFMKKRRPRRSQVEEDGDEKRRISKIQVKIKGN